MCKNENNYLYIFGGKKDHKVIKLNVPVLIMILVLSFISLYFAAVDYDSYVYSKFYKTSESRSHYASVTIQNNENKENLLNELINYSIQNDVDLYQMQMDGITGNAKNNKLLYLSNNSKYWEELALYNQDSIDLKSSRSYNTTNDIFMFLHKNYWELTPLTKDSFDYQRSIIFCSNDNIERLLEEITENTNFITYQSFTNSSIEHVHFDSNNWIYYLGITMLFGFIINSTVVSKVNEISKKKLEGMSNIELFIDYYVRDIVLNFIFISIIILFLSNMIIPVPFQKITLFYCNFIKYSLMYLFIILVISVLFYLEISTISINLAIKGKHSSKSVLGVLWIIKLLYISVCIPYVSLFSKDIYIYLNASVNYQNNQNKLTNLYKVSVTKNTMNMEYDNLLYSEKMINTYYQFYEKMNAFKFNVEDEHVISVSDTFGIIHGICNKILDKPTVFISNNKQLLDEDIKYLNELFWYQEYDVIRYDKKVHYYSTIYSQQVVVEDEYLIYWGSDFVIPHEINTMIFYSEYDLENTQTLFDNVLMNNGISPLFTIESLKESFERDYANESFAIIPKMCFIILFMVSYFILALQILHLNIYENSKRYYLEYVEGRTVGSFIFVILFNLIIFSVSQSLIYFFKKDIYLYSLSLLAIILILDTLIMKRFYNKTIVMKGRQML